MSTQLLVQLYFSPALSVPGRAILPQILSEINSIANASDPLKLAYQSLSYKPFLSLFNMTGAAVQHPELAEIGEFATNHVRRL